MENNLIKIEWRRDQLWRGCVLASIAHAIMVAHFLELSNEHSWDGMNYSCQDSSSARGTITFNSMYCVAAFRDDESDRMSLSNFCEANKYFQGASQEIFKLAETETLQYLLENVNGRTMSTITTAFWGEDNFLFTNDTFNEMLKNGGFLLERQVMDFESAMEAWKEYYDMTEGQCNLLKSIYERKISNPNDMITLTKDEINLIESNDEDGLQESITSFEEVGIYWEK